MKTKKFTFALMLIIAVLMITQLFAFEHPKEESKVVKEAIKECVEDSCVVEEIELPTNFDYVYRRFKVFNPDIDTSTVITFNNVCTHYELDATPELLKLCVGQMLLESRANQYREDGRILKSYAGATGFTQIMPNTAYGNLKKYVTDEEAEWMYSIGCTSIDFIKGDESRSTLVNKSVDWVEIETNNIALWGFIMRRSLDRRPLMNTLVGYNLGVGGMQSYVRAGGNVHEHKYVKMILGKLSVAEANL